MTSLDCATRLLRGGFSMRDAAAVLMWTAEHFKFNPWDALIDIEEIAPYFNEPHPELPYYNELLYLRRKEQEGQRPKYQDIRV